MTPPSYTRRFLDETADIARELPVDEIEAMAAGLAAVRERGGRLFILGVGGGAGHASHAVNDFRKICHIESYTPADNVSELTARTNDEGWDTTYVAWLRTSRMNDLDAVLVFSVGGGSREHNVSMNLVHAVELAKEVGAGDLRDRRQARRHDGQACRRVRRRHVPGRAAHPARRSLPGRGLALARVPPGACGAGGQMGVGGADRAGVTRARAAGRWARHHAALCALLGAVLAFYLWTASTSGGPFAFGAQQSDYYNLMSDGFLSGHLWLDVRPAPELLALPDPYVPEANAPYRLHDASLYEGRYYLQWGPVPALLAFIPFRILPFGDLPASLAAALFAFMGLCFAVALLRFLVRTYLPGTPRWMVGAGVVALATGSAVPFVLRRVAVYEIALLSAYAFLMAAVYFLTTGAQPRPARPRRLAAASLCMGLAVGCRPTMALPAAVLAGAWWWLARRDGSDRRRLAVALLGPVAACGFVLALYNVLRFGSPLEFGNTYQLAGADVRTLEAYELSALGPGLWFYLLAKAHVTTGFPFIHLSAAPRYPGTLPARYLYEVTGGVLANIPIALGALAALGLRRPEDRALRRMVLGLGALGLALVAFISFSLVGATMRYETDFASLLVLAGVLGWIALALRAPRRAVRRGVAITGAVLVAWGALYGVAISFVGYYDGLRAAKPGSYEMLENLTSPLPTAVAMLKGVPLLTGVLAPNGASDADPVPACAILSLQVGAAPATVTIVSNRDQRYRMTVRSVTAAVPGDRGTDLRVVTPGARQTLRVRGTGRPAAIELSLTRGINRVELSTPGPLVRLDGVSLAGLGNPAPGSLPAVRGNSR